MGSGGNKKLGACTFWVGTYPLREYNLGKSSHFLSPNIVGSLQDGYVRNVPLPRVPGEQRASPELTAPKARIRLPGYSLLPAWIPTLPKLGNVLGFSQRLL